MTSAPPKAIKAFVTGVIKDKLLELPAESVGPETALLALLKLELVQRGVLVSLKDGDENIEKWDAVKTIDAVRTTIGKALLLPTASALPEPLLAASAVMAGRTAELGASVCRQREAPLEVSTKEAKLAVQTALKRCKEVEDARFQVLLELCVSNPSLTAESNASNQSIQLLQIAQGYFLRGAHIQPDTPQMWKKAYDAILLQNNQREDDVSPADAAVVLTNMARIATSKGNAKRATELSLRAAESYLQMAAARIADSGTNNSNDSDAPTAVTAFVTPYQQPTIAKPLQEAHTALKMCQQNSNQLSPEELFVLHLLKVQLVLAQEDTRMEEDAQFEYKQALNRAAESNNAAANTNTKPTSGKGKSNKATPAASTSTTKVKPPSLVAIREKTRHQILVEGDLEELLGDKSEAAILRDAFLEQRSSAAIDGNKTSMRQQLAASVLRQVLERNRDRVKVMACQKKKPKEANDAAISGWTCLTAHVKPYLQWIPSSVEEGSDKVKIIEDWIHALSEEEVSLIKIFSTLVPCLHWMAFSSPTIETTNETNTVTETDLKSVKLVLDILVERTKQAKRDYEAASNVLKSSTEPLDVQIRQAECARGSVQALLVLQHTSLTSTTEWKVQTDEAIRMAQHAEKYTPFATEHGTGLWNLLLTWNGLQQSSSPWSFCTAPEARLVWKMAQTSLTNAKSDWGRSISKVEQCVLDMAKADAECGILSGGFANEAVKVYRGILERVETDLTGAFRTIVQAHCRLGLARIALYGDGKGDDNMDSDPTTLAQESLQQLALLTSDHDAPSTSSWTLTSPLVVGVFLKSHVTTSRQLVADALVRSGRLQEAKVFLEDAVRDAPEDADAAFSLGAFLLRDALSSPEKTAAEQNTAKIQLLQAARLDSRKAGPFALLGLWYENQKDLKRALGCYSKALLLDAPNPVAGRGVLRLTAWKSVKSVIDAAIQTTSPVNGWAWRALGKHKVMVTGENDLGAVALLKALRCRDIDQPQSEAMSPFFSIKGASANDGEEYTGKEKAETWAELAFCYRRIGRYTAAIRGYYSSIEAAGDHVSGSVLCACAEAELGLGLAEDAAEKFKRALEIGDAPTQSIAAYGQGSSLLSLAQRDAQDGKAGAAYESIQTAIEGFENATNDFGCTHKLLGDLYSFGATLPPTVFNDYSTNEVDILNQIAFVGKGEAFYKAAVDFFAGISEDENETKMLQAALTTDAGANILLQSQLTAFHQCQGMSCAITSCEDVQNLCKRASTEFRLAIELWPDYAPAWCGLGCSLVFSDPLLAQHAFCRSLQLDSLSPDAYSNLGFLYTAHNAFEASKGILDALTQVADSPMMWINRALILERNAAKDIQTGKRQQAAENIAQAADAYRAALQVVKHPSAMLGLALTCRVSPHPNANGSSAKTQSAFEESYGYMLQYKGKMGSYDASAALVEDIAKLERGGGSDEVLTSALANLKALEDLYRDSELDGMRGPDLAFTKKCLSSDKAAVFEEEKVESAVDFSPPDMALARRIVHEPQRGDLWVDLAKQLLRDKGSSKDGLKSAEVAAGRAVHILTHQLTFPDHLQQAGSSNGSQIVSPRDLSDALSLKYWLDGLIEPTKPKKTKQEETEEESSSDPLPSTLELQKALMMCPNNKFARQALLNVAGKD